MPRFNVQHPQTGKWRCFSTVTDYWVSDWMDENSYEKWRKNQYGNNCGSVYDANQMTLEDAESRIELGKENEQDYD